MEIHAGEGGTDSKLFVHDLFAAYVKYAKSLGLKTKILNSVEGQVSAQITGTGAGIFESETGSHCIQRVPPTERGGRRQTSFVMVAVLPMPPKHKTTLISEKEITVETMRGSGSGGQHRNTTDSCVRIVHKPTKISVSIDGRDQHANRREAHRILSAKVGQLRAGQVQAEYDKLRKNQIGSGGRGKKKRTYNFIKSRAVDHQTGKKTSKVKEVIEKGRFDLIK